MTGIAPLREFVTAMTALIAERPTERALLPRCSALLGQLISRDGWLPAEFAAPGPEEYRQYLLHCDPLQRFSVVSFVWGPGQQTPIHDHRVWGAIGMLRGREQATSYSRDPAEGALIEGATHELLPGDIDLVSPRIGDIHRVRNALPARPSISIHVYGANIGAVERRVYDPETGAAAPFVSGYSNRTVPNLWDLSH